MPAHLDYEHEATSLDLLRAASGAHLAVGLSWPATAAAYLDDARRAMQRLVAILPGLTPVEVDDPSRRPLDLDDLIEHHHQQPPEGAPTP